MYEGGGGRVEVGSKGVPRHKKRPRWENTIIEDFKHRYPINEILLLVIGNKTVFF